MKDVMDEEEIEEFGMHDDMMWSLGDNELYDSPL